MRGTTRRKFIEKIGKAALAVGAGLTLEEVLSGCAPTVRETRQDVAQIKLDCNPILPIPKDGCYIGGYRSPHFGFDYEPKIRAFTSTIGKQPATWDMSFRKFGAINDYFPAEKCKELIDIGVIPALKYGLHPLPGFKEISKGRADDIFKRFAAGAAKSGLPYIFQPFKEMNITNKEAWNHGNELAPYFVESYRRMHGIFKAEGANKNTIWMPVFKARPCLAYGHWWPPVQYCSDAQPFYPGDDIVDLIGFVINNRVALGEPHIHFSKLFETDYGWAQDKHQSKPVAVIENVQSNNQRQHEFITRMYQDIPVKFPALKIIQWWETIYDFKGATSSWTDDMTFSTNPKSVNAMREAMKNPYYIGGPLPFLEMYREKS